MTTPMRERLIARLKEEVGEGPPHHDPNMAMLGGGYYDLGEIVDAILAELETPDEGMIDAGVLAADVNDREERSPGAWEIATAFTAMVRAIREGK